MYKWMSRLSEHYEKVRNEYPEDKLIILFDIDGTIVDLRYMMHYVLKTYDTYHTTSFFDTLKPEDIDVPETKPGILLSRFDISEFRKNHILDWYRDHCWSQEAILSSHQPFSGVMEVIRWFQLQPDTFVGLNTGRSEFLRHDTLKSLNSLGKEFKVHFTSEHLFMRPGSYNTSIPQLKVEGLKYFKEMGYRVFAMIDNEPDNLEALAQYDNTGELMLLHADTLFESQRKRLPLRTVSGNVYDIAELVSKKQLPEHIQFVWKSVNTKSQLKEFLSSNIEWGECDLRWDIHHRQPILRKYSFEKNPYSDEEAIMQLSELLIMAQNHGKSLKVNFRENNGLTEKFSEIVEHHSFDMHRLWFYGKIDDLWENGIRSLRDKFPDSVIECPVDHFIPILLNEPERVERFLKTLSLWGVRRFSVHWNTAHLVSVIGRIEAMGYHVNVDGVNNLQTFLQTVLLLPHSISSDFKFQHWNYFGKPNSKSLNRAV